MFTVVVTGPPGAGKSAVATALHEALGDAGVANALVEVDELERTHPPLGRDRALAHLALLSGSFLTAGYHLLVVTATVEDDDYWRGVLDACGNGAHLLVRLEAPPLVLERRIRAREPAGWSGLGALVAASARLARTMVDLSGVDLVLSTDGQAPEDVAARIAVVLRERVILDSLTAMRVTQKGQVTIPLEVRRALGIQPGTNVEFTLDDGSARLVVDPDRVAAEVARMRGAGDVALSTDEILALTRR